MEKMLYWIWFSTLVKMNARSRMSLIADFDDAEEIYNCNDYSHLPYLSSEDKKILANKNLDNAKRIQESASLLGQTIITYDSDLYPAGLKGIFNPPYVLYLKGTLPDLTSRLKISIIGTRHCTSYGLGAVKSFAYDLSERGAIIISGMARGIDSAAAIDCIEAGGFTIAVLGSGIDVVYPPENRELYESVSRYGLLLSEFPPGSPPHPHHFPMRNRIISGLSDGVLVVESAKKGWLTHNSRACTRTGKGHFCRSRQYLQQFIRGNKQADSRRQRKSRYQC